MKQLLPIFLLGLILMSSCASKRNYNKAQKFDNAGLYTDAANLYFKSLKANKNNIDAKLGLQRTGQLVLEDKVEVFQNQYNNGTAKDAVYAYRAAESYYNQLSALGVKLILSEDQKEYYLEVKDKYLDILYQQAMKALSLEEFNAAETQLSEIISIDANFKDSQSQWVIAKYEPIYRHGNQLIQTALFRSAYADFQTINKATKGYKNSLDLQAQCLDKATVSIAVLPISYKYRSYRSYTSSIKDMVVNEVSQIKSPFYKLISDASITSIPNWANTKDPALALKIAKREGCFFEAKTILSARLDKFSKQQGQLVKKEKRAYLKQTVEVTNPDTQQKETKVKYTKVRYYEYEQKHSISLSLSYGLDRVDKDEKALADNFYGEKKDHIHYAQFDGNYKQLVAGTWKYMDKETSDDQVYDSNDSNSRLHQLFKNNKEIKSIASLESSLLSACAEHVSKSISNYQPEN
ncbi:hypothetical protein [Carboxylicivirga sp. M1479]|uniref:hypothetical protein n=1 Tax=Carboxylicivirga sp. M1479 TaxID=2594476 RepID=UPI001177EA6C|nr:hypothetical protein [Carboxylicivirga sp. M1479]TRX60401.1 hypothetical protein FNN09_20715 [Carboxylicivirga sp. M1479]